MNATKNMIDDQEYYMNYEKRWGRATFLPALIKLEATTNSKMQRKTRKMQVTIHTSSCVM